MTEVHERRLSVGDVTLNVAEAGGDGPAVLLLHGFPDRWQLWRHQVEALAAAGHRVIAPDLRGFGESDRPEEVDAYRLAALVGDVRGLLDALGVDRATVMGHDWGAGLAWSVVRAMPERVDALVALSVGDGRTKAEAGEEQRGAARPGGLQDRVDLLRALAGAEDRLLQADPLGPGEIEGEFFGDAHGRASV